MIAHLYPGFLLMAALALVLFPFWHLLGEVDGKHRSRARLRRAAFREGLRQEMSKHPVDSRSWEPYRRPRADLMPGPYMGRTR